ncbi:serine hydrolase domain-containing protein [Xanthomarina gelatinilytica]|uniref:serine hydrolase domain-containing protein n=1 Tax=Xanthomarina gelatinilytica TaxID=1137281 RepID=UPI003AA8FC70
MKITMQSFIKSRNGKFLTHYKKTYHMKTSTTSLALSLLICLLVTDVSAQNRPEDVKLKQELQIVIDSLWKANGFPGLTLSVVLPDNRQMSLSTGFADTSNAVAMQPTHRMLSGSNGKSLFIAAALVLSSQKYYTLDDRIENYLSDEPWFHRLPNAETITMRMLMDHTSGLEEYYELGNFMALVKENPSRTFTPIETLAYIFDRDPLFAAGTDWGYADTNFILLGYILEKISGKTMYSLVEQLIVDPYNLNATQPSISRNLSTLAIGHSRKGSPFPFEGEMVKNGLLVFNPQFEWMGGGFVSNVNDLTKWAKQLYTYKKMDANLLAEMKVKVPAKTGKNHGYGLGIQIRPSTNFGESYGHSGWFPGYLTDAVYFPDKDIAMAIQFNTDDLSHLKMAPYDYILMLTEKVATHLQK